MKIVGHRGAAGLAEQNTLGAIKVGLDCGVDAIEIDIRLNNEAILVLSHDPLPDNSNQHKNSAPLNLEDALSAIFNLSSTAEIFLDCKGQNWAQPLDALLTKFKENNFDIDRIIIISFYFKELAKFRRFSNERRLYLLSKRLPLFHLLACLYIKAEGSGFNYRHLVGRFPIIYKKLGLKVYYYTVNDPVLAKKYAAKGLDYIATDLPNVVNHL